MKEPKITIDGKEVEVIGMSPTAGFADREDIMEAFKYAQDVMERSTSAEMAIYGTTAIQVVWNTIANRYHLIPKEDV
jgi:hypothetical protein